MTGKSMLAKAFRSRQSILAN
jgi:hypothetical protein